jgi:hypothetical protein
MIHQKSQRHAGFFVLTACFPASFYSAFGFAPAGASYLFCSHKKRNPKNASRALVLRMPSAIFPANGSS